MSVILLQQYELLRALFERKIFQRVPFFYSLTMFVVVEQKVKGETDLKTENMYYNQQKRSEVKEEARRLRRKFLRYQQAEIVYSLSHKKLMELANDAGAIYRMDGIVLINREIFDEYLEQFHEK